MTREEILNYVNIGRDVYNKPKYTKEDIKKGVPDEECLVWAITIDGKIIPNAGYYPEEKRWVKVMVRHGLANEYPIEERVVAYIVYNK